MRDPDSGAPAPTSSSGNNANSATLLRLIIIPQVPLDAGDTVPGPQWPSLGG